MPFDKQDPKFVHPPATMRMRCYVQDTPRNGHKWWPGEPGNIYGGGYHCKQCGLRMWTEHEDVVLSKYVGGEMPTCAEMAVISVMEQ